MKENTAIQLVAAKALPALSGATVTYNAERNVYLTTGYTSQAGQVTPTSKQFAYQIDLPSIII